MSRSSSAKRAIHLGGLIAALVVLPAVLAIGQQSESDAPIAEVEEDRRAVALEQIPDRAVSMRAELKALLPGETSRLTLERIGSELDGVLEEIESTLKYARRVLEGRPNIRSLQALEVEIDRSLEQLRPWNAELDSELDGFREALERLDAVAEQWKATAELAKKEGAGATTLSRVAAVRSEARDTRKEVLERRNQMLALRDRLVDPSTELQAALDEAHHAGGARLEGLFEPDRQPLWSAEVRESIRKEWQQGGVAHVSERLQAGWRSEAERLRRRGLEFALFVLLFFALRSLRSRAEARAEDDYSLRDANRVFEQPAAMALVVCTLLTTDFDAIGQGGSTLLSSTLFAGAALVIGRRFMVPAMAPIAWGFAIIFVVDRVRDVLNSTAALERVVFVLEMVGALVLLLWLLRPKRLASVPPELRSVLFIRMLGIGMRAAVVILVIAIAADLGGWGDVSNLIGGGVLFGGYTGFFVFVLLMVVEGVATFALVLKPLCLLRSVSRHRLLIRRRLERVLSALAVALWAAFMLMQLGLFNIAEEGMAAVLEASVSLGAVSVSVGAIAVFAVTVWLSFVLSRLVNFVLSEDVFTRVQAGRGVPYAIAGLVRYTMIFAGFLVGLAAAGVELGKLTVVAGGLGVGIGFGLQNVVNNFVSGLILLFERPIQVGDTVQLPEVWGVVKRIGLRSSVVRTFVGAEVIVPNGTLVSEQITNWTLSDKRRRVHLDVGVQYGTPAQQVIDLLVGVAEANSNVIPDPAPQAFFMNFGDSALEFELRAWIASFDDGYLTRSDLAVAVQEALDEAGIGVPFPQRDLHVVSVSPDVSLGLGGGAGPRASERPVDTPGPGDGD